MDDQEREATEQRIALLTAMLGNLRDPEAIKVLERQIADLKARLEDNGRPK